MERKALATEWCLLQNQFDSYEKHSLYIKLISIVVLLAAEITGQVSFLIMLVLLILWLQDAIWKTFQSRIEPRLLYVEKHIAEENIAGKTKGDACQFNSEYHKVRLNGFSLMNEYVRQAIRPTVAFPHVVLILLALFFA